MGHPASQRFARGGTAGTALQSGATQTAFRKIFRQLPNIDALLLDSCDRTSNRMGGTGLVHDWNLSAQIVRESPVPVILAGGLTSANVAKAIDLVHPWGVDVNTGVTGDAGGKSAERCRQFVSAAKAATGEG